MLKGIRSFVPWTWRHQLRQNQLKVQRALLPFRKVTDFGELHRLTPIDRNFGWSRGQPIDRYYIEGFLSLHSNDIHGRVLEFQSNKYTREFGGTRVTHSDILDCSEQNPRATIVADIAHANSIPPNTYDCIICTQVLGLVFDSRGAVDHLRRILKFGGIVLVTVPGIAHKRVSDQGTEDYWRFTSNAARRLFSEVFGSENVEVKNYGNVLAATAFLHGLAVEEFSLHEIDYNDPEQEITVAVRAVK
jgi:SAM-dependent methyltransferase